MTSPTSPTQRIAVPLIGVAGAIVSGAAIAYFLAFLSGAGVSRSIDAGGRDLGPIAVAVDLALVLVFGLQHSVMARPGFKRRWTRFWPPAAERSAYVLASSAALFLLSLAWRPIGGTVWNVEQEGLRIAIWAAYAGGILLLAAACAQIDGLALIGLRQSLEGGGWLRPRPDGGLVTRGLYRWMRHPIQAGWLLIVWVAPTMTWGHFLLAASMTAYIVIGTGHEQRHLEADFGDDYRRYRERTGAFLPRLRRARAGGAG